jgi:hypothetical protein
MNQDINYNKLDVNFELMLNYIILNNGNFDEIINDNVIIYNEFYNNLFM